MLFMSVLSQNNPNVNHLGPRSSGKAIENFVIMMKPNENSVCILNTSAQFCKLAVDFYFEKPRRSRDNDFLCTVFVEDQVRKFVVEYQYKGEYK